MITTISRIRHFAQNAPNKIAIIEAGQQLSYAKLDEKSSALACFLHNNGMKPGQVVGCLKETMTDAFITALACLKLGVGFTILDTREDSQRIKHVFNLAEVKICLTQGATAAKIANQLGYTSADLGGVGKETCDLPEVDANALAYIEPTSGSTGKPKLVAISQKVLDHYTCMQAEMGQIGEDDIVALLGEMWFDTLFSGLNAGATLAAYNLRKRGSADLPKWLAGKKVSVIQTYVAAFRGLCEAAKTPLPDLKNIRLSGEGMNRKDIAAFEKLCLPGSSLTNYFGSTECSFMAQYRHQHGDVMPYDMMPAGKSIAGSSFEIVNENMQPVAQGAAGVIINRARFMSDGYLNNPEKTKGTYWQETNGQKALYTGDLGYLDEDGILHIVGRADDQVKIRGYSVRYGEVEEVISRYPGIETVSVTSFLSPRGQRQLSAHFITDSGVEIDTSALRDFIKSRLPAYMVPNYLVTEKTLPKTASGKILRRKLQSPLGGAEATFDESGKSQTEKLVGRVWVGILGHSNFDVDQDFFDIGGDSLQAMSMLVELEQKLKQRIGYESLIIHGSTIAQIAKRLDGAVEHNQDGVVLLKEGKSDVPIYILPVENGEFSDWLYLLNAFDDSRPVYGVHVRDQSKRASFASTSVAALGKHAAANIIQHNATGPYFICGFSAGCQNAFETAKALKERDKPLAGMLLIDPPVIAYEPFRSGWKMRRILSPLLKHRNLAATLNRAAHIWLKRPAKELHIADEVLFWGYRPTPETISPALMISCLEENPEAEQKKAYWSGMIGDDLEIWDAPGNHIHIVREPNAQPLAMRLQKWFNL